MSLEYGYSETEYELRTLVDRLATGLVQDSVVEVLASDSWLAEPEENPPRLWYRVADIAVLGDLVLFTTLTEISKLLFSRKAHWPISVEDDPKSADHLFSVVETARTQSKMSKLYDGTGSIFSQYTGDVPPTGVWSNKQVIRDFPKLPDKWRFVMNVHRTCYGLLPIGSDSAAEKATESIPYVKQALKADSTEEMLEYLVPVYKRLLEVTGKVEEEEEEEELPDPGASDSVSDFEHPPAEKDDGKPGGEDGSAGKRQHGVGLAGPDDEGGGEDEDGDGEGAGGGEEESESESHEPKGPETQVKGDVFRDMVNEVPVGEGGKAIDNYRNYFNKMDREARKVEKLIHAERETSMNRMANSLGSTKKTQRVRRTIENNAPAYEQLRSIMEPMISALRRHAELALRDNAADRYGGAFKTGRRLKRNKLYRAATGDERLNERKVEIGGKSYCIGVACDQSSSMGVGDKQVLAAAASICMLEAFEGIIDTTLSGFFTSRWQWRETNNAPVYKMVNEPIHRIRPLLFEVTSSSGSTPMGAGLYAALNEVQKSRAQVKAIVLVSDGIPTDGLSTDLAIQDIHRKRIQLHALAIGGIKPFHLNNCRRVVDVTDAEQIVPGFLELLRGIVRREAVHS